MITVTLPDGSSRQVADGAPVSAVAADISPRLAKAALAAVVDDKLVDLTYPLTADARVRIVTDQSPEALPLAREALELGTELGTTGSARARILYLLAASLPTSERAHALELAGQALALYRANPEFDVAQRRDVEKWLAAFGRVSE